MSTNLKKEITLVTDIVSFAVNHTAVNATSSNSNFDRFFKIQAWVNAVASPACESSSYLANTVTVEGAPVLIMLTPKNPSAANVFKRLYDELAEMVITNVPLMTFTLDTTVTCYNPAIILSQLPPYKPEFVTYIDAMASLVLMANIPGAFYIETITDGAYLHLPNHQTVEEWPGISDGLVLECYSARDLKNNQSSRILLSSKYVTAIAYIPESQLLFLRNTTELFDYVGKGNYDLPTLYSSSYLDAKVPAHVGYPKLEEPVQRYYGPSPLVISRVPGQQPSYYSKDTQANYADLQSVWPHDRTVSVWNTKTNSHVTVQVPKGISIAEHIQGCPELSVLPPHLKITNVSYETQY